MSYIGNPPAEAYTNTVKDTFSGDGSTVAFTLSLPTTTNNVRVVVENVVQDPTVAYGVSGTTLTFTSAPPSGTNNIYVVHLGPAVQTVQPPTELSGNFTLTGDLTQTGDYALTGAATVSGNLTVDTDTLFVDATNNRVGVGTSSPAHKLTVAGYSNVDASNTLAIGDNADYQALIYMESANETLTIENTSDYSGRATIFKDNGSERMRIDSGGNLLVGKTAESSTTAGWQFKPSGEAIVGRVASDTVFIFQNSTTGSTVGSISITASSTAYNTSSDYRLKENVVSLAGAADRLAQIPVHRFNFIADPDTIVDGFLAHEVQDVVPEAVTGEKDAVDADGNPVHQGIDQSKLVPLLTAALQEALQKIDALEARVAALEV